MKLTENQFKEVAKGHVQRVVDNMDTKTLMQIVYDNLYEYFTGECECRESAENELMQDIMNHEGDSDSVHEFLVGTGEISNDKAEEIVDYYLLS